MPSLPETFNQRLKFRHPADKHGVICWQPRLLGNYRRYKWLKVYKRRQRRQRGWGEDWWDDDYQFSMEWLSQRHNDVELNDAEKLDYQQSVLEDFTITKPAETELVTPRSVPRRRLAQYDQPFWFNQLYTLGVVPLMRWYFRRVAPRLERAAVEAQETKHVVAWEVAIYRVNDRYLARDPKKNNKLVKVVEYEELVGYVYERDEVVETPQDYMFLDTRAGRWISVQWPKVWARIAQFFLDAQNVKLFSLWVDLGHRGFSPLMARQRLRARYKRLANLAFFETYFVLFTLGLVYGYKKTNWVEYNVPALCVFVLSLVIAKELGLAMSPRRRMFDIAPNFDKDVRSVGIDKPVDPMLEEIYDPSDTLHTHIFTGFDAGMVGQDELSLPARISPTGPLLLDDWVVEANEGLAHFTYSPDREAALLDYSRLYYWVEKRFPRAHKLFVKWGLPGFKDHPPVMRRQFDWWMHWGWHSWYLWGRTWKVYPIWMTTFYSNYEFFLGILRYAYEISIEVEKDEEAERSYVLIDYENWQLVGHEERERRLLYGPPLIGYID